MPVTITAALAVKGNDFISRAIPIDRFTLYSNFKNSFYNPPAFISQIIPGVDAIYLFMNNKWSYTVAVHTKYTKYPSFSITKSHYVL